MDFLQQYANAKSLIVKYKKQIEGDEELAEGIQDRAPSH